MSRMSISDSGVTEVVAEEQSGMAIHKSRRFILHLAFGIMHFASSRGSVSKRESREVGQLNPRKKPSVTLAPSCISSVFFCLLSF